MLKILISTADWATAGKKDLIYSNVIRYKSRKGELSFPRAQARSASVTPTLRMPLVSPVAESSGDSTKGIVFKEISHYSQPVFEQVHVESFIIFTKLFF